MCQSSFSSSCDINTPHLCELSPCRAVIHRDVQSTLLREAKDFCLPLTQRYSRHYHEREASTHLLLLSTSTVAGAAARAAGARKFGQYGVRLLPHKQFNIREGLTPTYGDTHEKQTRVSPIRTQKTRRTCTCIQQCTCPIRGVPVEPGP